MKIFSCLSCPPFSSKTKLSSSPFHAIQGNLERESDKADGRKNPELAKCRIEQELKHGLKNPPFNCSFGPIGDNIFQWEGAIMGPSDTPFEDGIFLLSINFTADYPLVPPKIKFKTKVFHPNITEDGTIYMDILGPLYWAPALTIEKVLLSICSLLPDPNPEDPLNPVCKLYRTNRKAYNQKARKWTKMYAMG
ncbi:unnamed protein product [Dovyalis caffra]|uniref:UBC core domain-containing protein n=1 Tax=Dovyalis caffra TaxID=77055 RepID=A0AAV1R363_9ROSI|nr:unnamed protein product [Dovyalis caffra]